MVLTLHHLNDSRSQRVLWLLEELEVPYEVKFYYRTAEGLAPAELKAVHPLALSPVITDGDFTLAESGPVVEYLIRKYDTAGKFKPTEAGMTDDNYYVHYCEGSLMPILVNELIFTMIPQQSPFFIRPLMNVVFGQVKSKMTQPRMKIHADLIESHLEKSGNWFAGGENPTAADFMMSFALEAWSSRDIGVLGPKTKDYVKRIHARPAYRRGLEKGGPYSYAKL